jgi:G3E family GTPase
VQLIQSVPVNLVTGFLGAGKTTLIQSLLARRPAGERWAVLVNEFGQIGIDQTAFGGDGIYVKEVPGGCICCANQLPMQIALSQLLARAHPARVLIEPTGLGHPRQILELLGAPEWRESLQLQATVCVVDARQLKDERVTGNDTFQAQIEVADVLLFSKDDVLTEIDRLAARDLVERSLPPKARVGFIENGAMELDWLQLPATQGISVRRSLLHTAQPGSLPPMAAQPPYHYVQEALGRVAAGWVLPPEWMFRHDALLNLLFGIRGTERIKGVFHTEKGWIFFNATALDTRINSSAYRADSRLEIIAETAQAPDWETLESALLATRAQGDNQQ